MLIGVVEKQGSQLREEMHVLAGAVANLERRMHNPPCPEVSAIKESLLVHMTEHSEKKRLADEDKIIRKKFWYNVSEKVVAAVLLSLFCAIAYAFRNGFQP